MPCNFVVVGARNFPAMLFLHNFFLHPWALSKSSFFCKQVQWQMISKRSVKKKSLKKVFLFQLEWIRVLRHTSIITSRRIACKIRLVITYQKLVYCFVQLLCWNCFNIGHGQKWNILNIIYHSKLSKQESNQRSNLMDWTFMDS